MARSPSLLDLVRNELAGLVARFYLLALVMIAVAVAIPIFVLTGLGLVTLSTALSAEGTLATVLGVAWLIAFLGGTAFAIVRIVRWLRPVTEKVESLADPRRSDAAQVASVQNLTSSDRTRTQPPTDAKGDPLIAEEIRRRQERQRQ